MKTERFPHRLVRSLSIASLSMAGVMGVSGCGGTFILRPDGSLSYTTPEILKAPIIREK